MSDTFPPFNEKGKAAIAAALDRLADSAAAGKVEFDRRMTESDKHGGMLPKMQYVYPDQLDRLRELRLWHWLAALRARGSARSAFADYDGGVAADFNELANQHFKFVQTLNDFFPAGDTAEADAAKVTK